MLYTPAGSVLTATATGKVGVGTTAQAKLDVRGDVKLGTNGQLFAAGGEENLRIIRGVIDAGGNIIVGSGFQLIHSSDGHYSITFATPCGGRPAITATLDRAQGGGRTIVRTEPPGEVKPFFTTKEKRCDHIRRN